MTKLNSLRANITTSCRDEMLGIGHRRRRATSQCDGLQQSPLFSGSKDQTEGVGWILYTWWSMMLICPLRRGSDLSHSITSGGTWGVWGLMYMPRFWGGWAPLAGADSLWRLCRIRGSGLAGHSQETDRPWQLCLSLSSRLGSTCCRRWHFGWGRIGGAYPGFLVREFRSFLPSSLGQPLPTPGFSFLLSWTSSLWGKAHSPGWVAVLLPIKAGREDPEKPEAQVPLLSHELWWGPLSLTVERKGMKWAWSLLTLPLDSLI